MLLRPRPRRADRRPAARRRRGRVAPLGGRVSGGGRRGRVPARAVAAPRGRRPGGSDEADEVVRGWRGRRRGRPGGRRRHGRRSAGQAVRGTRPRGRGPGRGWPGSPAHHSVARRRHHSRPRRRAGTCRPRWRGRPVAWRIAIDDRLVVLVRRRGPGVPVVVGSSSGPAAAAAASCSASASAGEPGFALGLGLPLVVHRGRDRRRRGSRPTGRAGLGRLAPGPVLERRADRERAREAVRLLMGERARRRLDLRVAAVPVIGTGRALIALILERDEGAGRGTLDAGQCSVAHRGDDTRPRPRVVPIIDRPGRMDRPGRAVWPSTPSACSSSRSDTSSARTDSDRARGSTPSARRSRPRRSPGRR